MWIILILSVVLLLIVIPVMWVLFARIVICIDSKRSLYYVEMRWLVRCQVHPEDDRVFIRITVPFKTFEFDPVEEMMKPAANKKKEPKKPDKKKKTGWFKIKKGFREVARLVLGLLRSIMHSFQIERFYVNIDTRDYPLNARLIPVFNWINWYTQMRYYVNFKDQNTVHIVIKNRLVRIVFPVVKTVIRLYT